MIVKTFEFENEKSIRDSLSRIPYRVFQKKVKRLFDHRTKEACSIIELSFDFNKQYSNLDVETKFTRVRHE